MSTTFLISWLRNVIYYKVRKDFLLTVPEAITILGGMGGRYEIITLIHVLGQCVCVSSYSSSG